MEERSCRNCDYFSDSSTQGECRRFPPKPDFPKVKASDWCGDFEPSKKAKVEAVCAGVQKAAEKIEQER